MRKHVLVVCSLFIAAVCAFTMGHGESNFCEIDNTAQIVGGCVLSPCATFAQCTNANTGCSSGQYFTCGTMMAKKDAPCTNDTAKQPCGTNSECNGLHGGTYTWKCPT